MPLTKKGKKIERAMERSYGKTKGKRVFYASARKGRITNVERTTPKRKTKRRTSARKRAK